MSFYVLTTTQELPESYRTGLTVEDKVGIASRFVEIIFVNKTNYETKSFQLALLPKIGAIRLVDNWTVTSYIAFETLNDANNYIALVDEISGIGQQLRGNTIDPIVPRTLVETDEGEWELFRSQHQIDGVIPTRQFSD